MITQRDFKNEIRTALNLSNSVLTESGNYANGFWTNILYIDLEKLSQGENTAFSVAEEHDTYGTTFRVCYGIDVRAKLPDGVLAEAIVDYCAGILENYTSLTAGFSVEYDGNNWKATWDTDCEEAETNAAYWFYDFPNSVMDLPTREVYDLAFDENRYYVWQNIAPQVESKLSNTSFLMENCIDVICHILMENYVNNNEIEFINYKECAEKLADSYCNYQ